MTPEQLQRAGGREVWITEVVERYYAGSHTTEIDLRVEQQTRPANEPMSPGTGRGWWLIRAKEEKE